MFFRLSASLGVLAVATGIFASGLEVRDGKLAVTTIDGATRLTQSFDSSVDLPAEIPQPLALEADEVLRVSFRTFDPSTSEDEGQKAPEQVFAVLANPARPERQLSTPVPIKKGSGNRASFTLRLDRMPATLLSGSGRLSLHLLLGSSGDSAPLAYELGEISVPSHVLPEDDADLTSREKQAREQGFYGWPAEHHTFAVPASESMPPAIVSIIFAVLTLGLPWALLLGLWSSLGLQLTKGGEKPKSVFLGVIVYLELVAVRYWIGGPSFTLFNMLPWLVAGGVAAVATGRYALGQLAAERLGLAAPVVVDTSNESTVEPTGKLGSAAAAEASL